MTMLDLIALDADDTLWQNAPLYRQARARLTQLLSTHQAPEAVSRQLHETEVRNLEYFGYGIKSYVLSMVDIAIEVSEGRITGDEIQRIVDMAKEMSQAPVRLFEHTERALQALAASHDLMVVTKGDLFDQENKIARSGLADYLRHVEVVSEKDRQTYEKLLVKYDIEPARFLMVGNSLKSDVLPAVAVGGQAVYIPYEFTWEHETVEDQELGPGNYFELEHIGELPELINRLTSGSDG